MTEVIQLDHIFNDICHRIFLGEIVFILREQEREAISKWVYAVTSRSLKTRKSSSLDFPGKRAEKVLKQMIRNDILRGGAYQDVGDNIYLVDRPKGESEFGTLFGEIFPSSCIVIVFRATL